jgi:hypothetical protein
MKFEDDVCRKNLFSMMTEKAKILVKTTNQGVKAIKEDDVFGINSEFQSRVNRISMPLPVAEQVY